MVGHRDRRYKGLKNTHRNQYLGPLISHEMNRCITCYRCERLLHRLRRGHRSLRSGIPRSCLLWSPSGRVCWRANFPAIWWKSAPPVCLPISPCSNTTAANGICSRRHRFALAVQWAAISSPGDATANSSGYTTATTMRLMAIFSVTGDALAAAYVNSPLKTRLCWPAQCLTGVFSDPSAGGPDRHSSPSGLKVKRSRLLVRPGPPSKLIISSASWVGKENFAAGFGDREGQVMTSNCRHSQNHQCSLPVDKTDGSRRCRY